MFDPTTEDLWKEVQAAIAETEQQTKPVGDLVRRYTGRWYRKDQGDTDPDPENFGFAFLSNILPQLAIDNPQATVKSSRVVGHEVVSQAMTDGTNTYIDESTWTQRHLPVLADFCFTRGVTLHFLDEDSRFSRGYVTPAVKRVPPERFFQDALAEDSEEDEFRGHWFYADLEDLQNDERALPDAVAQLTPQDTNENTSAASSGDDDGRGAKRAYRKPSAGELGRRRVKVFSVWMRRKNTIRVLAEGSKAVELYEETPYYGEPGGPYVTYDAYPVPSQPWPLSPLIAVEDQSIDLNIHARAMGRAAARRKSIGLVEAANPDLGDKVTGAEDGEIVPVKGITGNFVQIELGGATPQQYQITEYLRDRLDRVSGMTATVQGSVGEADTATEAQIADNALANRIRFLRNRVIDATERSLEKVAWYLYHTEGIVIPVNRRDPYSGEQMEGVFFGGPWPTDAGASWDDFSIKVIPFSMQRESEAAMQGRILGFYEIFVRVLELAGTFGPAVRVMNILRDIGEAFQMTDKADEWVVPEFLGAYGQPPMYPPSRLLETPGPPGRTPALPYGSTVGRHRRPQPGGPGAGSVLNNGNGRGGGPGMNGGGGPRSRVAGRGGTLEVGT